MELTWAREIMKSIKLSFVSRLRRADLRRLIEWCNKGVTISPLRSHKKKDWMWRKKSKYYTKTQALFFLPFHAVVKDHRRFCRLGRSLQSRIVHIKSAFFFVQHKKRRKNDSRTCDSHSFGYENMTQGSSSPRLPFNRAPASRCQTNEMSKTNSAQNADRHDSHSTR